MLNKPEEEKFDKELLYSSFVSLNYYDVNCNPKSIGSGFIVDCAGRKILLTAGHVIEPNGTIMIEVLDDKPGYMKMVALPEPFIVKVINTNTQDSELIDIAFIEMPSGINCPSLIESDKNGNLIKTYQKMVHDCNFGIVPSPGTYYAFSGLNHAVELNTGNPTPIYKKTIIFEILTYAGSKAEHLYAFEPVQYNTSKKYYEGCSGSPIIDNQGNVVSMLVGGSEELKQVWGVKLSFLQSVFTELKS